MRFALRVPLRYAGPVERRRAAAPQRGWGGQTVQRDACGCRQCYRARYALRTVLRLRILTGAVKTPYLRVQQNVRKNPGPEPTKPLPPGEGRASIAPATPRICADARSGESARLLVGRGDPSFQKKTVRGCALRSATAPGAPVTAGVGP